MLPAWPLSGEIPPVPTPKCPLHWSHWHGPGSRPRVVSCFLGQQLHNEPRGQSGCWRPGLSTTGRVGRSFCRHNSSRLQTPCCGPVSLPSRRRLPSPQSHADRREPQRACLRPLCSLSCETYLRPPHPGPARGEFLPPGKLEATGPKSHCSQEHHFLFGPGSVSESGSESPPPQVLAIWPLFLSVLPLLLPGRLGPRDQA